MIQSIPQHSAEGRFETIRRLIEKQIDEYGFTFASSIPQDFCSDAPTVGGYFALDEDSDDPLYVVFIASMLSTDVLMIMTDADPLEVADVMAFLLLIQAEDHLSIGEVLKIPQTEFLIKHAVYACTLLKPSTLNYFKDIKHSLMTEESHYHMLMPVFINQREYKIGQQNFEALLDHFEDMNRDLLSFASKSIPSD